MLLAEELLLIVLDDETGELQYTPGVDYAKLLFYALPTALLMDLVLLNRLSIENNEIQVFDPTSTTDELLDKIVKILRNSPAKTIPDMVNAILGNIPSLQEIISKRLTDKGIVKQEGNKYMKKVHPLRYPLENPEIKYNLMHRVSQALSNGDTTDSHLLYLIGILLSLRILQPEANDHADVLLKSTDNIIDFHNLVSAVNNAFLSSLN